MSVQRLLQPHKSGRLERLAFDPLDKVVPHSQVSCPAFKRSDDARNPSSEERPKPQMPNHQNLTQNYDPTSAQPTDQEQRHQEHEAIQKESLAARGEKLRFDAPADQPLQVDAAWNLGAKQRHLFAEIESAAQR